MTEFEQNLEEFDIESNDLNFVTGGAKIDTNIDPNFKETFNTQICDCGKYEPAIAISCIHTCDNCKWSRTPNEGTSVTFCTKQSN